MMPATATVERLDTARPLVEIDNVGVIYASSRGRVEALRDVRLDIRSGEFISILGPSGCGKSTLLKLLAGLERPTSGQVRIDGKLLSGPPDGLGVVLQRDVLLDWRTVLDNVLLIAEFQKRDVNALRPEALRILERFGLAEYADRHPWELSGGMRQRAAICRALLTDPSLLLMDEPFGALDAMTRDDLNLELARLWQETRKTVVFITHSIAEAVFLSDRIAVMSRNPGRIVEIVEVDLPRPRSLASRETAAFTAYTRRIREIFTQLGVLKEG